MGRPPRINREMIAAAAHELGLDGLTLRDVADHLGVSIAALYHHVSSKDELMRLAAAYSASRAPVPEDRGQHWAVWLYEWAVYNRDVFVAQPGLLEQYIDGAIPARNVAGNVERILSVLVHQGFSVVEASEAYELVSTCAIGTAVGVLRERHAASQVPMAVDEQLDAIRQRDGTELTHVGELIEQTAALGRVPFEQRIATLVAGIAVRRGDDWAAIEEQLAAFV